MLAFYFLLMRSSWVTFLSWITGFEDLSQAAILYPKVHLALFLSDQIVVVFLRAADAGVPFGILLVVAIISGIWQMGIIK